MVIQSTKMVQGYLVTLTESGMHLKACNPGCVSSFCILIIFSCYFIPKGHNIFQKLNADEYRQVISYIKHSILSTDLAVNFRYFALSLSLRRSPTLWLIGIPSFILSTDSDQYSFHSLKEEAWIPRFQITKICSSKTWLRKICAGCVFMGGEGLKENVLKENFWVGGEGKVACPPPHPLSLSYWTFYGHLWS